MSIVVFGASGNIGSNIRKEALSRGHRVTAVTRSTDLEPAERLTTLKADIADADDVAKIAAGHDAVISAYSPGLRRHSAEDAAELIREAHDALFAGIKRAGVRLIIVGGVGSLEASPGIDVVDSDFYPAEHKAHTLRNREILRSLKRGDHDLDWTYVSPPLSIKAGERTGKFRLDEDRLLRNEAGESRISEADFAIAILDELGRGQFVRRRFTAAY
ncbi:NAD(P)-dependent oxidoreductase [Rhizobium leguminosarum]|uniref:NAD(P)-dependent oxidoreductase n=1 Tax=Rhizobium leguminosarum TaxID=384 RepID=UPI00103FF9EA|nr:NAD(P)-dependent oxidoreductase [Rhizobium leguminosarum]MBY5385311.1 NAD(P)-dependent oxidoreductase [Rhizobium leguminosarum]MBY5788124.1 NAD(P)-dependent oxidoreductase [Rhizobium leguminosarum]MCA2435538.1 NAD(P)-dependent oxidoreductase [Rhizobium leguminosarum]NEH73652.1 NAD(P)H-binding protein [Rhizobium leguminosarum]NEI93905.1 NAD(P)H-binding protein [Rhizobium leguminosarum]